MIEGRDRCLLTRGESGAVGFVLLELFPPFLPMVDVSSSLGSLLFRHKVLALHVVYKQALRPHPHRLELIRGRGNKKMITPTTASVLD